MLSYWNWNGVIIGVDFDGVVGELVDQWLLAYNRDFGDTLCKEDIVDWNVHKFVKPECGLRIYDYLENPGLYDHVQAVEHSIDSLMLLKAIGFRIVYITHTTKGHNGRKFQWLIDHGLLTEKEDDNYIEAKDKNLIRVDYLVDDKFENALAFNQVGKGILLTQPWNRGRTFPGFRANSWKEVYDFILRETYHA